MQNSPETNQLKPTAAGEDTEIIRSTFRMVVQLGAVLISAICMFDSVMFYLVGDPQWWWGSCVSLACIPAYFLMDVRRSFGVFVTALLLMLVITVWYCAHIALRWGGDINFHYKLLAIVPLVAVSGRFSVRSKWIWILACTAGLVALDHRVSEVAQVFPASPAIKTLMQALNFGVPILTMAALVMHYFKLVTRQQAQLNEHATIDPLTGLMNRRRLREVWMHAEHEGRRGSFPLSIVLCDVDHFKAINDKYGHDMGDQVLRQLGQLMPREVRIDDSVCRWGGEEFLLLLPHCDQLTAMATANRIRATIAATPIRVGAQALSVTVTMGVATFIDNEKFEAAAHRADVALYAGKVAGRNRVVAAEAHYTETIAAA